MVAMSNPPNILLITSDQHRGDSLSCAGHPCVRTPHLDMLAHDGVRYDQCFSDCPVCIPSRTTLITGIQSHRYGSPSYNQNFRIQREREKFLGSLITAAGYHTGLMGKTHWHTEPTFRAGFEQVTEIEAHRIPQVQQETGRPFGFGAPGANELHPSLSPLPHHLYSTDWVVDRSIEFLQHRDQTQPFFLWTSLIDPHPPLCIHEPFYSMYDDAEIPEPITADWAAPGKCPHAIEFHRTIYNPGPMPPAEIRKARAVYYGMITNLDYQLTRLFGYIKNQGQWDNTWIVYTSDHGEFLCDFGNIAKSAFMNCAARIPLIVRPPRGYGHVPGSVSDSLVTWADLLPTLCEIAGAEVPDDICGRSILPTVNDVHTKPRADLHGHINASHMYHDGRYKYLYFTDDGRELVFDTIEDRNDEHDLSGDEQLIGRLRTAFIEHLQAEGHDDLVDGKLRNEGKRVPPLHEWRGQNPMGWPGALNVLIRPPRNSVRLGQAGAQVLRSSGFLIPGAGAATLMLPRIDCR